MIDFHSHILPGLDDGAKSLDESTEIASILVGSGFSEVYCTPHMIKGGFDNEPCNVRKAVIELKAVLTEAGISITLHPGAEYFLDEFLPGHLINPLPLDESSFFLVEAPMNADFDFIKECIYKIVRSGFVPLLAHPERYVFFDYELRNNGRGRFQPAAETTRNVITDFLSKFSGDYGAEQLRMGTQSSKLKTIIDMGCKFQGNIGSFAGIYGEKVRRRGIKFLQSGLYALLGTDAHSPRNLEKMIKKGLPVIEQEIGKPAFDNLLAPKLNTVAKDKHNGSHKKDLLKL